MPNYYTQTNPCYPCAKMEDPQVMPFRQMGMMPFGFGGQHIFHHHFFHPHFPFGFGFSPFGFGFPPFGFGFSPFGFGEFNEFPFGI